MTSGVTMAGSGIEWVDITFNSCVILLAWIAGELGITYEELNIYLFVIIGPSIVLLQSLWIIWLLRRLKRLSH